MRRPRLFWRIYATYLVVIVLCTGALGFYVVRSAHGFYVSHTEQELLARARLVGADLGSRVGSQDSSKLQQLVRRLGRTSGTRITLIAAGKGGVPIGTVLADSEVADPASMDNHAARPEVSVALRGGVGLVIRRSATLHEGMMYVAIPVDQGVRDVAVVRTAMPLDTVNQALGALYLRIALSALAVAALAALVGLLITRRISGQMREITVGAERFAAGQLEHKLYVPRIQEFAVVAESLNRMAEELNKQIATLTRERNQREAVLTSMVEGVLAVDAEARVFAVNAAAGRLLDLDADDAVGKSIQEIVRNPDLQRVVDAALEGQEPVEADIAVRVGAEDLSLQANGTLLRDVVGSGDAGAVVVLNDVTRLKRLEAVRRDFVANVSHELKTPVTSIKGFAETLDDGAIEDRETAHRFVRIISGQADRLNAIIGDLLALSSLDQTEDGRGLSKEEADVCDLVRVAADVCESRAKAKNIALEAGCEDALLARVNAALLEQAVINLVDNAVKYSPEGSRVEIALERPGDELVIRVRDEGPGIPSEHLPRLFERFYRVDKARSRDLGGTGLGLAIVKHIAQVHGGRVSVESVVGRGSTFRIHLPLG
jgi:two-component system, OmpR family, phosphate regulon sensor histidine kinase PhoR